MAVARQSLQKVAGSPGDGPLVARHHEMDWSTHPGNDGCAMSAAGPKDVKRAGTTPLHQVRDDLAGREKCDLTARLGGGRHRGTAKEPGGRVTFTADPYRRHVRVRVVPLTAQDSRPTRRSDRM